MKPIGLIGRKQVGKSTAASHLESKGYTRLSFKTPLVEEIKANFPTLLEEIRQDWPADTIDQLFEEKPPLMRALLQNYGTDVRRKDDANYWVKQWIKRHELFATDAIVADDVRFINEAAAIKDLGGIIIKLERPDILGTDMHVSETEHLQITPDYTINVNKGEHDKLYAELDRILAELK